MSTDARLTTLEHAMAELAIAQARTQANLDRLSEEMRAFRDEMRAHVGRSERDQAAFHRKLGEIANSTGMLTEDIVAPGIPGVFRDLFHVEVSECLIRQKPPHRGEPGRRREFDVVAWGGDVFLMNETRSRLRPSDLDEVGAALAEVRAFFPETEGRRVLGSLASFRADPSLVRGAEGQGLLVFGLSGGLMESLNSPGFEPKTF